MGLWASGEREMSSIRWNLQRSEAGEGEACVCVCVVCVCVHAVCPAHLAPAWPPQPAAPTHTAHPLGPPAADPAEHLASSARCHQPAPAHTRHPPHLLAPPHTPPTFLTSSARTM